MIKIIEKEPYKNFDNWNNRECLMYPTMMIKDGKEHFIFNRREPDAEYQEKENQKRNAIRKNLTDCSFQICKQIIRKVFML